MRHSQVALFRHVKNSQPVITHEGCAILISHDVHLIEVVADQLLLAENGHVSAFDGDMTDYKNGCWQNLALQALHL